MADLVINIINTVLHLHYITTVNWPLSYQLPAADWSVMDDVMKEVPFIPLDKALSEDDIVFSLGALAFI